MPEHRWPGGLVYTYLCVRGALSYNRRAENESRVVNNAGTSLLNLAARRLGSVDEACGSHWREQAAIEPACVSPASFGLLVAKSADRCFDKAE